MYEDSSREMAKVEFDPGIESVTGILMGTDPFYIRRYPGKNGVMHIVQARPDRSGHTPSKEWRDAYRSSPSRPLGSHSIGSRKTNPYRVRRSVRATKTSGVFRT